MSAEHPTAPIDPLEPGGSGVAGGADGAVPVPVPMAEGPVAAGPDQDRPVSVQPTLEDLRAMSAELDEIDEALRRMDADPEATVDGSVDRSPLGPVG